MAKHNLHSMQEVKCKRFYAAEFAHLIYKILILQHIE